MPRHSASCCCKLHAAKSLMHVYIDKARSVLVHILIVEKEVVHAWTFVCCLGFFADQPVPAYAHAFSAPPPPPSAFSPPPPPPPGAWVFKPDQILSFAKIDDALSISPYLTVLRSLLKVRSTPCRIHACMCKFFLLILLEGCHSSESCMC